MFGLSGVACLGHLVESSPSSCWYPESRVGEAYVCNIGVGTLLVVSPYGPWKAMLVNNRKALFHDS